MRDPTDPTLFFYAIESPDDVDPEGRAYVTGPMFTCEHLDGGADNFDDAEESPNATVISAEELAARGAEIAGRLGSPMSDEIVRLLVWHASTGLPNVAYHILDPF